MSRFVAMIARAVMEEAPASFSLPRTTELPAMSMQSLDSGVRMARHSAAGSAATRR